MRTSCRFQMIVRLATLTVVLLSHAIEGEEITSNTTNSTTDEPACIPKNNQLCVPKCCDSGSHWTIPRNNESPYVCTPRDKLDPYEYDVFYSNETHINTTSDSRNIPVYHRPLACNKSRFLKEETFEFPLGLITYNSSVILVDLRAKQVSLIPPSNYCVEYSKGSGTLQFQMCGEATAPIPNIEYHFYFAFLILSTICYFASAAFYIFVLKLVDTYKKCFVGFAISMGFAFFFLILLHATHSSKCCILGFFFYLFAVSGFLWLMFMCLDLTVEVRFFREEARVERWWWYLAASIIYPSVSLFISIIPDGKIDIPNSFIKELYHGQNSCRFDNPRLEPFFVSVGLLMLGSLIFLIATIYYIRVNNRDFHNNFSWLDKRSSYKYMCRSCLLTWIIALVWVVETGIPVVDKKIIYLIQSVQGICTFLIFVSNRYMRREVFDKCRRLKNNANAGNRSDIILETLGANDNQKEARRRQETSHLMDNHSSDPKNS